MSRNSKDKNKALTIISCHVNADFDALASMLAAQKLYPEAKLVFPGSQEKNVRRFLNETGIKVVMEYPGFKNIAKRVATLIATGSPADIVWYGAGQAMDVALEGQLADVGDVIDAVGGIPITVQVIPQRAQVLRGQRRGIGGLAQGW